MNETSCFSWFCFFVRLIIELYKSKLNKDGNLTLEYYPTEEQCRRAENKMIVKKLNNHVKPQTVRFK